MDQISIHSTGGDPLETIPPMSLDKFMEKTGISPATCWRYRKKGWLKTVIISGRHYVTAAAIVEFNERAARGEFSGRLPDTSAALAARRPRN